MKKKYIKPQIVFESFAMNTHIAGDCERIVGNPSKEACGIPGSAPGQDIFSTKVAGCGLQWDSVKQGDEGDMYEGFCYHVPTEAYTLFNS